MNFRMSTLPVIVTILPMILGGCSPSNFGTRGALPRPILLSASDRITPETRLQIDEVNYKIQQLAEEYQIINSVPLPIP
jgi:hypothetical protein